MQIKLTTNVSTVQKNKKKLYKGLLNKTKGWELESQSLKLENTYQTSDMGWQS